MSFGSFAPLACWSLAYCSLAGCPDASTPPPPASASATVTASASATASAAVSATSSPPGHLELVDAPLVPIAPYIADEVARARRDGVRVLVYEGATWCEPCVRFHKAAEAGELDADFPGVRFLVFDADRDGEELDRAGYTSQYIPLFAVPNPDGTASTHKMQGGTKGDRAVREIAPRLRMLLDTTAAL